MPAKIEAKFTMGEIHPLLFERVDIEQWHKACQLAVNVEFLPQGGFRNRPGLVKKGRIRRTVSALSLQASHVTTAHGGNTASLFDSGNDYFTTSAVNTTSYTVLELDLLEERQVCFVDLLGFKLKEREESEALTVQYSTDKVDWSSFPVLFDITKSDRSRRFSQADSPVTCRYIRVSVTASSDASKTLSIKSLKVWTEEAALSPVSTFSVTYSEDDFYILVLTDRNIDVFRRGVWQASVPVDIPADKIAQVTSAGRLVTLLLFHKDLRPMRLKRQGGNHEWNSDLPSFTKLPDLSKSGALDDEATGKIMSDDNGWPRCGAFFQTRLWLGGFRSAPTTVMASQLTDFFAFDQDIEESDAGIEHTFDSDEHEAVRRIYVGRHLCFFTDRAEWYTSNRSIDANEPVNMVLATRNGISASPRLVFVEGGILFTQKGGGVVRDFLYSDVEQSYTAHPGTLFGAHLIGDVVSLAHRRAAGNDEGHMVFMVNADGTACVMTMLRAHKVSAQARLETGTSGNRGKFRSVIVDGNRDAYFIVEHGGQQWLWQRDETALLDGAVKYSPDQPETVLSGLDHLEGRDVHVLADGDPTGPFRVSGGTVTLDSPATVAEAGLLPALSLRLLPVRRKDQAGREVTRPMRLYRLGLSLLGTGQISFRMNSQDFRDVPLREFGQQQFDTPMMSRLFDGETRIDRIAGWSRTPELELSRNVPAPVLVRALKMEVK